MTCKMNSELIMNIEKTRRELNELVSMKEILDPQIIEKSEELDKLIYDYEFHNEKIKDK